MMGFSLLLLPLGEELLQVGVLMNHFLVEMVVVVAMVLKGAEKEQLTKDMMVIIGHLVMLEEVDLV
jgi:hypothetical protein